MAENKDWRKCQDVVKDFQTCIEESKKTEITKCKTQNSS